MFRHKEYGTGWTSELRVHTRCCHLWFTLLTTTNWSDAVIDDPFTESEYFALDLGNEEDRELVRTVADLAEEWLNNESCATVDGINYEDLAPRPEQHMLEVEAFDDRLQFAIYSRPNWPATSWAEAYREYFTFHRSNAEDVEAVEQLISFLHRVVTN